MLLDTFVFATTHWYSRQLGFTSATFAARRSPAGRGAEEGQTLSSQSKWTEIHVRKKVQYSKAKVWITFHGIWAMNRARPCPSLHCCTRHLLLSHLLTSDTFLHLIPSYTVVQPPTFHCIFFFPFSQLLFFFFFELPLPLKFSKDNEEITSKCKKSSDTFLCISYYVKIGYDLSQDSTGAYRCVGKQAE